MPPALHGPGASHAHNMTTETKRIVRHWKETFDETERFVFIKRLRLGLPNHPWVFPGDPLTDDIRSHLGSHRLKVWWEARVIASVDYAITLGLYKQPEPEREITPTGRGWFQVRLADGTVQKVRGREAAEKLLNGI